MSDQINDSIMEDNWLEYIRYCKQTNKEPNVNGFWNWYKD